MTNKNEIISFLNDKQFRTKSWSDAVCLSVKTNFRSNEKNILPSWIGWVAAIDSLQVKFFDRQRSSTNLSFCWNRSGTWAQYNVDILRHCFAKSTSVKLTATIEIGRETLLNFLLILSHSLFTECWKDEISAIQRAKRENSFFSFVSCAWRRNDPVKRPFRSEAHGYLEWNWLTA